jgi:hypothetical protein
MDNNSNRILIDGPVKEHFVEISKWAKFLGIVGFVLSSMIALVSFFTFESVMKEEGIGPEQATVVRVAYWIIAILYFMFSLWLYRFAKHLQLSFEQNDQGLFNDSIKNLKYNFRFLGILMIIQVSFIVIALMFALNQL